MINDSEQILSIFLGTFFFLWVKPTEPFFAKNTNNDITWYSKQPEIWLLCRVSTDFIDILFSQQLMSILKWLIKILLKASEIP